MYGRRVKSSQLQVGLIKKFRNLKIFSLQTMMATDIWGVDEVV